jgi:hypothetical protein
LACALGVVVAVNKHRTLLVHGKAAINGDIFRHTARDTDRPRRNGGIGRVNVVRKRGVTGTERPRNVYRLSSCASGHCVYDHKPNGNPIRADRLFRIAVGVIRELVITVVRGRILNSYKIAGISGINQVYRVRNAGVIETGTGSLNRFIESVMAANFERRIASSPGTSERTAAEHQERQ